MRLTDFLDMVDLRTADRILEDRMIGEYPGILRREQIRQRKNRHDKAPAEFYCLDRKELESFLEGYDKSEYEIYQEPVDLATTSMTLYMQIMENIDMLTIGHPTGTLDHDMSEPMPSEEDAEIAYLIEGLDRTILIQFLGRYINDTKFSVMHSRTGYRVINRP